MPTPERKQKFIGRFWNATHNTDQDTPRSTNVLEASSADWTPHNNGN
jgi:hypothetical protein